MSREDLTPTSYALLGLLAVKPWTTYELAQQMDRTLSRFWPRARSKVYEEPKKLVAHGLARASAESTGRRPRTVYTITAKGRRALARWLGEPGDGPALESEQVLRLFFADHGAKADMAATLADLRGWVYERTLVNVEVGRAYLAGQGPFPERAAVNMVVGRLLDDFLEAVDRWAAWAAEVAEGWPDDIRQAVMDEAEERRSVAQSTARARRYEADLAAGRVAPPRR